jgi:hypothetical protein
MQRQQPSALHLVPVGWRAWGFAVRIEFISRDHQASDNHEAIHQLFS